LDGQLPGQQQQHITNGEIDRVRINPRAKTPINTATSKALAFSVSTPVSNPLPSTFIINEFLNNAQSTHQYLFVDAFDHYKSYMHSAGLYQLKKNDSNQNKNY
jgi:hypothetical protein